MSESGGISSTENTRERHFRAKTDAKTRCYDARSMKRGPQPAKRGLDGAENYLKGDSGGSCFEASPGTIWLFQGRCKFSGELSPLALSG